MYGVSENVAAEIQRSLDFYSANSAEGPISRIYLSGGTAKVPSLYRIIEQKLGVPVEIINPFKNIEVDGNRFNLEYLREVAPDGHCSDRSRIKENSRTMIRMNLLPTKSTSGGGGSGNTGAMIKLVIFFCSR